MIHVPIFGVPEEATLGALAAAARGRHQLCGVYGIGRRCPLVAFEPVPVAEFDPDRYGLSERPERLILFALEADWSEHLVRTAREAEAGAAETAPGKAEGTFVMPNSRSRVNRVFGSMAASGTSVAACTWAAKKGKASAGMVLALGEGTVAGLRSKLLLAGTQTLTFLCPEMG